MSTISKKIESTLLKILNASRKNQGQTYKTSALVNAVLIDYPSLKRDSVSRALAKLVENDDHLFITRVSPGVYTLGHSPNVKPQAQSAASANVADIVAAPAVAKVGRTFVGISRDHSASMSSYSHAALKDYNNLLGTIKDGDAISESFLTTVICGAGRGTLVSVESVNVPVMNARQLSAYNTPGSSTPLFDSIGELIETMKRANPNPSPEDAFLVMIITDGEENSSRSYNAQRIVSLMASLQATDKWTFVFRVPNGARRNIERLGVPAGNIQEWELSTKGLEIASQVSASAITSYYADTRATGQTRTAKFFTDASAVTSKTLQRSLVDISKEVKNFFIGLSDPQTIREFVEAKNGGKFKKGASFYQLMKTETLQPYKEILIKDRTTGAIYHGAAARDLLGLPTGAGDIKVAPGNHGNYDIYVQSTSVNRILPAGTLLMYWENHGTAYQTGKSAA